MGVLLAVGVRMKEVVVWDGSVHGCGGCIGDGSVVSIVIVVVGEVRVVMVVAVKV